MSSQTTCKVYERIAESDVVVDGIRPGGLALTERALLLWGFHPESRVLDVGCGTGVTLGHLTRSHACSAVGIDASEALLVQGHKRDPTLAMIRAVGAQLPFAHACADGVIAECSLSVMHDPDAALSEFRRVLKTGASLIMSDVYARNPEGVAQLARIPAECCLRGAVTRAALIERLARHGFRIVLWEDHSDLLTKFAMHLIFSYGSMDRFWLSAGSGSIDPEATRRAISEVKPGYFLLIARKEEEKKRI